MIAKQLPSQNGEIRLVYDKLGRLVLAQTPKQRENDEWEFNQYDRWSRPVATGLCVIPTAGDAAAAKQLHQQLQQDLKSLLPHLVFDENTKDYQWNQFPYNSAHVSQIDLHTVTYYDSYDAVDLTEYGFQEVADFSDPKADFRNQSNQIQNMITATRVKVLDGSNTWLWTVSHYDPKG